MVAPRTEEQRAKAREYARAYYARNPEKRKAYAKKARLANPEKHREAARALRAKDPEKHRARCREWHHANRDYKLAKRREWGKANPEREKKQKRHYNLLKTFGISLEERDRMLAAQGGGCAICGTTCSGSRDWATDHCHASGKIRGILCQHCNTAIGHMRDDPDRLRKAASYLEHNGGG